MRNIQKQAEPDSLTQHRCKTNAEYTADYSNYSEKKDLQISLVSEQRGICCYCLQRIMPSTDMMKIEHWKSQRRFPDKQLEYSNMLGACLGGTGRPGRIQHCDTKKGKEGLKFNPSDSNHDVEQKIRFLGDGQIESIDEKFDAELNSVLNLNGGYFLKENRKGVLDSFKEYLGRKNPSLADLQKELRKWNGEDGGDLEPYCQVVVYYLKKKLKLA